MGLYSSSSYAGGATSWTAKDGRKFFVENLFLIRYPKDICTEKINGDEAVKEIEATIGKELGLEKLFSTARWQSAHRGFSFAEMMIGCLHVERVDRISLQGVIVKFHQED